ncbi:AbiV family abortive infection protein [Pseudarcicella hirudinis]
MNELNGQDSSKFEFYLEIYVASLSEAKSLLSEAQLLFNNESYERAYFLGMAALEEISKSQLAADTFTGYITEKDFKSSYRDHEKKINRVKWIQLDGNSIPVYSYLIDSIEIEDFDFNKKMQAMYVDVDFHLKKVSKPNEKIIKEYAQSIIKAVEVGLHRIHEVTVQEGEQIGTKGFMK